MDEVARWWTCRPCGMYWHDDSDECWGCGGHGDKHGSPAITSRALMDRLWTEEELRGDHVW